VSGGFVRQAECVRLAVRSRIAGGSATARGLAARCGVSQPHFCNWLAGRRGLSCGVLDAVVLECRVTDAELAVDAFMVFAAGELADSAFAGPGPRPRALP
jgi:hypothetical protein